MTKKKISFLCDVDSRIFIYPIARILGEIGPTIIHTTNPLIMCASDTYDPSFLMHDVGFNILNDYNDVFAAADWEESDYEFIIYDTARYVPEDAEILVIVVSGIERLDDFNQSLRKVSEIEEVYTLFYCPVGTRSEYLEGAIGVFPHPSHNTSILKTEITQSFQPVTEKRLKRALGYLLGNILKLPLQDVEDRLSRDWKVP